MAIAYAFTVVLLGFVIMGLAAVIEAIGLIRRLFR